MAGSDPVMSAPRVAPCYLHPDIWLIHWLKIINNSQHFNTALAGDPSVWRRDNHCHVTFSNIYVFPMPLLTLAQAAGFHDNQSEASIVSYWPIRGRGWWCHDWEWGWVTVAVTRRGELIKLFTLSPHSQPARFWLVAECQSWPLIGQWGVGRAGRQWSQVTSDSHHQSWLGN